MKRLIVLSGKCLERGAKKERFANNKHASHEDVIDAIKNEIKIMKDPGFVIYRRLEEGPKNTIAFL